MDLNYVRQEIVHLHIIFQEECAISPLQTHESGNINLGAAEALCCITQDFIPYCTQAAGLILRAQCCSGARLTQKPQNKGSGRLLESCLHPGGNCRSVFRSL